MEKNNIYRLVRRVLIWIGVVGGIILLSANFFILSFSNRIIAATSALPKQSAVMVFGGGMEAKGIMTAQTRERVETGVRLAQHTQTPLYITGDDGGLRYDEVSYMAAYAQSLGMASSSMVADPHGYRTYESCYRAAEVYGLHSIIVISHHYHLPRIIYLCGRFGVTTVGVSADREGEYYVGWGSTGREWLARLKAVWQKEITKPLPRRLD